MSAHSSSLSMGKQARKRTLWGSHALSELMIGLTGLYPPLPQEPIVCIIVGGQPGDFMVDTWAKHSVVTQ
jgi:hypothetical protein